MDKERELKIEIPEGYEIDKENSTFECIKFKRKELTYDDIAKELFIHKDCFFIDTFGEVHYIANLEVRYTQSNNCTSEKQAEKLLAINKLMNVAKYLNDGWKPDWSNNDEKKYYITIDNNFSSNSKIMIRYNYITNDSLVYFKTEKLAREAVRILGEDTIRLVYLTDYQSDSMFNVVKSRIKMLQSNIDYFYEELTNESNKI